MEESRRDGIETIEGIRLIKAALPGARTVLGISNVSFGLSPAARQALNSVFLHECQQAGLDAAIVNSGRILPLDRIDPEADEVCLDLIYDRRDAARGYDPLAELLALSKASAAEASSRRTAAAGRSSNGSSSASSTASARASRPTSTEALAAGRRAARRHQRPADRRHEDGRRPVRLRRDAAALRAAVGRSHEGGGRRTSNRTCRGRAERGKGKVVLATVKGDVHDIGKNLVDIILTNNGYEVHNLGHQGRASPR